MKKLLIIILLLFAGCFSDSLPLDTKQTRAESSDFTNLRVWINPAGTYTAPVRVYVTVTTSKRWFIRWTNDGTEPTLTNGNYSFTPIIVSKSCTLKFRAYDLDNKSNYSNILVANYIIVDNSYVPTPYTYNGKTYNGKINIGSGMAMENDYSIYLNLEEPKVKSFNCDGFFRIKGVYTDIDIGRYMVLGIKKLDNGKYDKYFIEGLNFDKRIWLRYGKGEYEIKLNPAPILNYTNYNADPEYVTSAQSMYTTHIWKVTNTRDEDGIFYYPSYNVQSDDSFIKNKAEEILKIYGATNGTIYEKCFSFSKYIADSLKFDNYAMFGVDCRQPQDAITCLKTGLAVCDGYSNTFASLCRSVGIKCKSVRSLTHAWNEVLMPDGKWLMVDCLWNDTGVTGWYSSAYLLRVEFDEKHIKTDDREDR